MSDFRGLVLTNTTLNEHDVIMNVLTDDGIVSVKAKGVLKANSKNRNMTEIGCYSLFHTIDRLNQKVYLLKNAESMKRFNIQSDLDKQAVYNCLLEGFNKQEISLNDALRFVDLLDKSKNPLCLYAFYLCHLIQVGGISLIVIHLLYSFTKFLLYADILLQIFRLHIQDLLLPSSPHIPQSPDRYICP